MKTWSEVEKEFEKEFENILWHKFEDRRVIQFIRQVLHTFAKETTPEIIYSKDGDLHDDGIKHCLAETKSLQDKFFEGGRND